MKRRFRWTAHTALMVVSLLTLVPRPVSAASQALKDFQRVVIADGAPDVQRAAAEELASYVGQICRHKIEIVALSAFAADAPGLTFFVGDEPAARALNRPVTPWKSEEWMLRTVGPGLVLAGDDGEGDAWSLSTPAGSMLAVYTLLEDHLGVRWFWPGEFGEHVPSRAEATLPALDERRQPGFGQRKVTLGLSSIYHPKTSPKTERNLSYHTAVFREAERKWARRARLGSVKAAGFSHSWGAAFEMSKGVTYREHPDWFALVNGKRSPTHVCTTHPDVISRMVEHVLKSAGDIVSISPSDGGGFCECDRCRALDVPGVLAQDGQHVSLSDRIFTYANEVARRVRERNPAKGCGMFAYTYYNKPPVKIRELEPNLYLAFVYQSAAQRDPENLREWRESVAGWKALDAKLMVREGWGNHYYHDLPFLHDRQIIANLAEASRLGFVGVYGESSKCFATMAPNFWALTHMMWDPQRNATHLMRDFYESAYGPVAAEMEAFFETYNHALDANWAKRDRVVNTNGIAYANLIGSWSKLIPPEAVEAAERHLKSAEARVPAGEYAGRVSLARLGQDYTRVMLGLLEDYRRLAALGLPLDALSSPSAPPRTAPSERDALLRQAFALGEQREQLLLAHRDWAGPDEGLYAFNHDGNIRQWHTAVKRALGIDQPSAVTKETLNRK